MQQNGRLVNGWPSPADKRPGDNLALHEHTDSKPSGVSVLLLEIKCPARAQDDLAQTFSRHGKTQNPPSPGGVRPLLSEQRRRQGAGTLV